MDNVALSSPAGPINPDETENFEEIEKQFAVKGEQAGVPSRLAHADFLKSSNICPPTGPS